jgi:hypothetical protein
VPTEVDAVPVHVQKANMLPKNAPARRIDKEFLLTRVEKGGRGRGNLQDSMMINEVAHCRIIKDQQFLSVIILDLSTRLILKTKKNDTKIQTSCFPYLVITPILLFRRLEVSGTMQLTALKKPRCYGVDRPAMWQGGVDCGVNEEEIRIKAILGHTRSLR